jgi:hypothetical protein
MGSKSCHRNREAPNILFPIIRVSSFRGCIIAHDRMQCRTVVNATTNPLPSTKTWPA